MLLVAGLPASGKTTFARNVASSGGILEFDDIAAKYGSYADLNEERGIAEAIFKNKILTSKPQAVVDSFHTRAARMAVASLFPFIFDIVVVSCPINECLARNRLRSSMVSNDEIVHMSLSWEPISLNEGYRAIYIYDSILNVLNCLARRN